MTEQAIKFNMGSLRSTIELTLHTYQATRLWTGREKDEKTGLRRIMGIASFFNIVRNIDIAASNNDPYADAYLLNLEKRLIDGRAKILELTAKVKEVIQCLPDGINVQECLNVQPAIIPIYIVNQMSYLSVYLLNAYDEFARYVLLANHIALMTNDDRHYWLNEGSSTIRSLFGFVQRYKNAGVTREDFTQGNARAIDAIQKFGPLPQEILDGTLRAQFAPVIKRSTSETVTINTGIEAETDTISEYDKE